MNTCAVVTLRILLTCAALLAATQAQAVTLCANSVQSLQTAFSFARVSFQGVTIRIATGTYAIQGLSLNAAAPIRILGGYNSDCTTRPAALRASDTVLDLGNYGLFIVNFEGSPISSVVIDGVSMINAYKPTLTAGHFDDEGEVRVSRARITGMPSTSEPVALQVGEGGVIRLDNVLMDALPGGMASGECSVRATLIEGGFIEMVNTTIALPPNQNLCLQDANDEGSTANLYNTIAWSAIQTSLVDSTVDVVNSFNSTYGSLYRHGGTGTTVGELHTDPDWINAAAGDYRLSAGSTSVNSGTVAPLGGLASFDVDGQPRWQGQLPDRGAYESSHQNAQTYVVKNTNNAGADSLREAMTLANQNPNLGTIEFDIPGACPHVIELDTALPKLTTPMLIDGITQPGAVANTDPDAFLPTLCVVVKPKTGTLAYGFNAAAGADDASLKLRGIAMGGFVQPVILGGGSEHVIAGNRFGGYNGLNLAGASIYSINVTGSLGNGSFIIGGPGAADRNLISFSEYSGIRVNPGVDGSQAHCQIVNNLIGTSGSGNTAAPNFTGMNISGNHCVIDGNRVVGNETDGIVLDGAVGTTVQRNIIGVTVNGGSLPNAGVGVRISSLAADNVIGAPLATYAFGLRNTIRYMADAGVVIESGLDNTVRSNEIRDNGVGAGELDIDLGNDGPTANDAGDVDTAFANRAQNFPLVSKVAVPAGTPDNATNVAATLTAQLDSVPGNYRIDAYFSNHCGASGNRGHADVYLGGTTADNLQVFTQGVTLPNVLPSARVSLTATDKDGNTSEMGTCFAVIGGSDALFKDEFE